MTISTLYAVVAVLCCLTTTVLSDSAETQTCQEKFEGNFYNGEGNPKNCAINPNCPDGYVITDPFDPDMFFPLIIKPDTNSCDNWTIQDCYKVTNDNANTISYYSKAEMEAYFSTGITEVLHIQQLVCNPSFQNCFSRGCDAIGFAPVAPTTSPSPEPTTSPSPKPTTSPSPKPTTSPSPKPTTSPSPKPTTSPSPKPTTSPSPKPTTSPSPKPTTSPSPKPTTSPSPKPTTSPSPKPTTSPSKEPTTGPTTSPSPKPTTSPSPKPTTSPSPKPTTSPSPEPTTSPSPQPSTSPTKAPSTTPTTSPTTCTQVQDVEVPVDVVFLIDQSKSVKTKNYEKLKNFLKDMALEYLFGPEATRMGVVEFGTGVGESHDITDDRDEFLDIVDSLEYNKGCTHTATALQYMDYYFAKSENERRTEPIESRQVLILATDGNPTTCQGGRGNSKKNAKKAAIALKEKYPGLELVYVPIGRKPNKKLFKKIADYVIPIKNFSKFSDFLSEFVSIVTCDNLSGRALDWNPEYTFDEEGFI